MKNLAFLFTAFLFLQITSLGQYGWFEQTSGTSVKLNSVYFINNDVGWAVGFAGTIIHTTNGGEYWTPQLSNTYATLTLVKFFDDNTGWIYGEGQILKTTNGGENWILLNAPSGPAYFLTNDLGWIFNFPYCLATTDGGVSWDTLYTHSLFFSPEKMCFINGNLGFIKGATEGINPHPLNLKTVDGGFNWEGFSFPGYELLAGWASLSFIDDSVGWACCNGLPSTNLYGFVAKTTDAGESWVLQLNTGALFLDIFFNDTNNGWTVEGDSIWHTSDGGISWNNQSTETSDFWHSIHFTNENNGWAVGENGKILHTFSGGVVSVIGEIYGIPVNYNISQNYPNPFNPSTKIKYSIPQSSNVVIKVFDILGNEIEKLVNEEKPAGIYELMWNAERLPSGVYFYQLKAGPFVETKKMVFMK